MRNNKTKHVTWSRTSGRQMVQLSINRRRQWKKSFNYPQRLIVTSMTLQSIVPAKNFYTSLPILFRRCSHFFMELSLLWRRTSTINENAIKYRESPIKSQMRQNYGDYQMENYLGGRQEPGQARPERELHPSYWISNVLVLLGAIN